MFSAMTVVPKNHLVLFAVLLDGTDMITADEELEYVARVLDIDHARAFVREPSTLTVDDVMEFLDRESMLGGPKVEGVVVANARRWYWAAADVEYPVMLAKMVRPEFREQHRNTWGKEHTTKGGFDAYKTGFANEARWRKAIQHLRDEGRLSDRVNDIGPLMDEIRRDVLEECVDDVKDDLWKMFSGDLARASIRGFAEFYKSRCGHCSTIIRILDWEDEVQLLEDRDRE